MLLQRFAALPVLIRIILIVEVLICEVNGLVMLIAPLTWYDTVPGVIQTGMFNQHFVRDIGLIYILLGLGFAFGAIRSSGRVEFWAAGSAWLTVHGLFHLWEVAVGICSSSALVRDFPGVTIPALIGLFLTFWAMRVQ